ncbi:MAG: cytochrome c biogenesis protein CcsA [Myxococcales bacterium]|nr:cytochrome c biogenesis protein CcsA [Myxococcales bacterium]
MISALSFTSFALAVLLYTSAAGVFFVEIARSPGGKANEPPRLAPVLLGVGALAHGTYVIVASFVAHLCPVRSLHFFLSMGSLVATIVFLGARRHFRVHALGVVVAPVGLVATLGTFFIGNIEPQTSMPGSFISMHVFANLAGLALFLLACGAAVMYLIQERRLKRRAPLRKGLPPLDSLDRAEHRFLLAGFPLLTLGVASGTVWASKLESGSPDELLRTIFGYATWLLIAGVLLLRVVSGWRGRRAAYGTVAGFTFAALVLAIYLARPFIHGGQGG